MGKLGLSKVNSDDWFQYVSLLNNEQIEFYLLIFYE